MIKILFVDDEPNILGGLRRMLRPQRKEWAMQFAESPEAALQLLESEPFDVVVSDMRMPGMDGATLLHKVKDIDPGIARIILSGQTDQEALLKATGTAHQFLSKPCDADKLKSVVTRSCALRSLMNNADVRRTIAGVRSLPSLPHIYLELTQAIHSEEMSMKHIGEIVSQDVALTAKVLQLVNSAFFGIPRTTENVSHAVTLLGADVVRALALSTKLFHDFDGDAEAFRLSELWEHSIAISKLAAAIAQFENAPNEVVDYAIQAGMLHDIGKLVLATQIPNDYREVIRKVDEGSVSLIEAEMSAFNCDHAHIGGYLLSLWGLPDGIVEAVAFHHSEEASAGDEFTALTAVSAANAIWHNLQNNGQSEHHDPKDGLERIGESAERIAEWIEVARGALLPPDEDGHEQSQQVHSA